MFATSADFRHGPDVPITRAAIDREQRRRVLYGHPPATPEVVVKQFVSIPEPRHLGRAYRLMHSPKTPNVKGAA